MYSRGEDHLADIEVPEAPEAIEALHATLGLQCISVDLLKRWRAPQPSPWKWGYARISGEKDITRTRISLGQQRLGRLCRGSPFPWCQSERAAGRCIHGDDYWRKRVAEVVAALDCGCNPMTCEICRRRGPGPKPCAWCQDLTGWEIEHGDLFREIQRRNEANAL